LTKNESKSEANIAQTHGNNSNLSGYSVSITLLVVVQRNLNGFASFKKLDTGLVTSDNGHTYQIEKIGTVCIKLFDGMIRELKDTRYIPQL